MNTLVRIAVAFGTVSFSIRFFAAGSLFVATPLTEGGFTDGIEGPACDRGGNIYCVSFRHARNFARVSPDGRTAYVTEARVMRLVQFRVDRPGLESTRSQR